MNTYDMDLALARIAYPEFVELNPMGFPKDCSEAGWWVINETDPINRIYWLIGRGYSPTKNWNQAAKFLDGRLDLIQKAVESNSVGNVESLLVEALRLYLAEYQNNDGIHQKN